MGFSNSVKAFIPRKESFIANVLTLMTGTAIAQLISVLISPVLTRLYSPEQFGLYALFLGITSILTIIATGRYELAIMLPEKDEDAVNVAAVAIIFILAISLITLIAVFIWNKSFAHLMGSPDIAPWLYGVPLSILLVGSYQTFNYWSNRRKHYKRMAFCRMSQSTLTAATNLGMGAGGFVHSGLILGTILGQCASAILMGGVIVKYDKLRLKIVSCHRIVELSKQYSRFPKYSIPADFINVFTNQIPIFLFSSYFGGAVVGFFSLVQKTFGMPIGLIGNSVLDIFKQRASTDYIKYGSCRDIYIKSFKGLLILATIPFLIFFAISPQLFAFVFGEKWRIAGEYAQILTPKFYFGFISSPLSYVIYISGKQQYDLIWQIVLLIVTLLSIMIGVHFNNIKYSLICISFCHSIMYIIYMLISYYCSIDWAANRG